MYTKKVQEPMLPDDESVRVAANFKRLRKERGWTIVKTAKKGGVSFGYISHLERGVSGLGKRARAKWATIFGVDVSEFLKSINPDTEHEQELIQLKEEVSKYSIDKIRRLRQIIPVMLGEGKINAAKDNQKKGRNQKTKK